MAEELQTKKKHKEWRKEVKKLRRKNIRQRRAEERNKLAAEEEYARLNDPIYLKWLQEQEELDIFEQEQKEHQRQLQEELWMRRELLARKKFREQLKKQEETAAVREAERLRIQNEFEELQRKAEQRREERQKREEKAKQDYELMMDKIFDYIELGGTIPEELTSNVQSHPNKPVCTIFSKTNGCRYGMHCLRNHIRPKISRILFIANFFSHIQLDHGGTTHAGDINLECSEKDLSDDYRVFFEDVTEELKKFGEIVNFRTCMNTQSHLRGNVFVEYSSERDALKAHVQLQGRFYASRQINVEFSVITSWNSAICGLSYTNKCPKGKGCNFLHIFTNPGNLYNQTVVRHEKDEVAVKTSQRSGRETSVMSWNDGEDKRCSRRDWRWSESPEPRSRDDRCERKSKETPKSNRGISNEKFIGNQRYYRNLRNTRTKPKEISSSRSSRHDDSHRSDNSTHDSHRSERSRHDSHNDSSSRSYFRHSESSRSDSHRSASSSKSRKKRKSSKSRSPERSRKHHKDDDREKHHKNKKHKEKKDRKDKS